MAAGGFHAVGRGGQDPDIGQAVTVKGAFDHLTRQDAGHEDGPLGDAVAVVAEAVDGQDHSAASCSSSVPMKPPDWRFQ